jgi:hypothetical protein
MRRTANDPIKTAHEPKANESQIISGAINRPPQANQDTCENQIRTLRPKCGQNKPLLNSAEVLHMRRIHVIRHIRNPDHRAAQGL